MKRSRNSTTALALGVLSITTLLYSGGALAANECRVKYGYFTESGSGLNYKRTDHETTVNMNAGQTLSVNRSKMNYVLNLKANKVQVILEGAANNNFTLDKDQRNPAALFYATPTKLKTLKCLTQTSAPAFGSPEQLIASFKQANKTANEIAQGLKTTFNSTAQQVAQLLKTAGYTANQVAAALKDVFNTTADNAANILKAVGYTGAQVAAALKSAFNSTAAQAANALKSAFNATAAQVTDWLKSAGYAGGQIAAALKTVFNQTAQQAAQLLKTAFNATATQVTSWLKDAGYAGAQVAAALKSAFNSTAAQAANVLKTAFNATVTQVSDWLEDAGYTGAQVAAALKNAFNAAAEQAASALKSSFNATAAQVTSWLKDAGYTGAQIAAALKSAFNSTAQQAAELLKNAFNATAAQVTSWLKDAGYTGAQIAAALKSAFNSTAQQAAELLKNAFNASANQVALWLKDAAYTAQEAATALKTAFNATAEVTAAAIKAAYNATAAQMTEWLKVAGYTGAQIAAALKSAFNSTAQQAAELLKNAFNATGAQVTDWLKTAGYAGGQIAAALKTVFNQTAQQAAQLLKTAFNATVQQLATWLKDAGYTLVEVATALESMNFEPGQLTAALRTAFNATADKLVQTYKQLQIIITTQNCGAAGCRQPADYLKIAGYTAEQAIKALRTHFNISVQVAHDIGVHVYKLGDAAVAKALAFAGFTTQQIASLAQAAATTTTKVVAQTMQLNHIVDASFKFCDRHPLNYSNSGSLYGLSGRPALPMPRDNARYTITLVGNNALAAATTGINGFPAGTNYTIKERGPCFVIVEYQVPTSVREGLSGQATLTAGASAGPRFSWVVGPYPRRPSSSTSYGYIAPTATSSVQPVLDEKTLYKVGSATTTDNALNIYTLLNPDKNSPHCQTVATPNPAYASDNQQFANRSTINVPEISWGAINRGSSQTQVSLELLNNGMVVAQQANITLNAGEQRLFTYRRSNNSTCVAKVGGGGECYHCGQAREGWNDNGISVRIR